MNPDVSEVCWSGEWHCHGCGATGTHIWPDEDTPHSNHECETGQDAEVLWGGEWECNGCGEHGDEMWTDEESTYSDHECPFDQEEEEEDAA